MRYLTSVLAMSIGLAGCASLSDHPEFSKLSKIGAAAPEGSTLISVELSNVKALGDTYLDQAKLLEGETRASGGGVIAAGLYGAAVTAFNPTPKNLLGALFSAGVFQAWRTGLKPGERAKVYVAGYRTLDCVWAAGRPLESFGQANVSSATVLRNNANATFGAARAARERVLAEASEPEKTALLSRLDALEATLTTVDAALLIEVNVMSEGPNRIAAVRRQVEANIDRRLDGLAPDYAAALKILTDASKLPSTGDKTAPANDVAGGGAPAPAKNLIAPPPPTLAQLVSRLEGEVADTKRKAPTLAARAYADLGHCVEVAA